MKTLRTIAAMLLALSLAAPALAGSVTYPVVLTNGTAADANQVMSNFYAVSSVVNGGIDSTNISPSLGINPSVLKCTSSTNCTVGAAYGVTITPTVGSVVPLTVNAPSGATSDLLDVNLNGTKEFYVTSAGVATFSGGISGIYPSSLAPTTAAQGTFGGSVGLTVYPNAAAQVPLTISGATGQTADLVDVTLTNGGTNAFKIASTGAATFGSAVTASQFNGSGAGLTATSIPSTALAHGDYVTISPGSQQTGTISVSGNVTSANHVSSVAGGGLVAVGGSSQAITDDGSGTYGWNFSWGSSSTGGVRFWTGVPGVGAEVAALSPSGGIETRAGVTSANLAWVPPVYNASGASLAITTHIVTGTTSVSSSSPATITLSGGAAFSSSSSYEVQTTVGSSGSTYVFAVVISSGTSFTINTSSGTALQPVYWMAIGS